MKKDRSKKGNIYIQLYDGDKLVTVFDCKGDKAGQLDNIERGQEVALNCNVYTDNAFFQVCSSIE